MKIMISQVGRGGVFEKQCKIVNNQVLPTLPELYKVPLRILDHRVFVNGEIEAFLENFEVRRNDSEVEKLFQVTETVGSLKYDLSRCSATGRGSGAENLAQLDKEVSHLLDGVNALLAKAKVERTVSGSA